ncbi:agmatinase family protein [Aggregicoccus sp. 17bor-14]|uniref:agmatinase family protein n=1 Tax=Myxococcaceae TaxID=31 RepID=UPI00129D16DB|nr:MULTISPECIES: agmatinase family protein [Myxococcaceae]MBF5044214.1 agmatinase family protein [Simulacricoccus sp. 17bor-14]MRI89964.1 agmatinase family protein [Aggregicoccus sp. 17bor-14]
MPTFDPNAAAAADSGIFGLPHTPDEAHVVILPVPFEATTSYGGGTSEGPRAVLEASRQVDLFDIETGRPYARGIAMLEEPGEVRAWNARAKQLATPIVEAGGVTPELQAACDEVNALCERMNEAVYRATREWLQKGKRVGVLGGDHSVPFGAIRAHAEKYPGLGLLHLDAHADLRNAYEGFQWSHASIFHNVMERIPGVAKLVQVGIRDLGEAEHDYIEQSKGRVKTYFDAQLQHARFEGTPWNRQVDEIVSHLPQHVYLTFDIDGLDPVLCPHTGTPVPGGLSFPEVNALIAGVVRSGRTIVGFDLDEVAPDAEGGEWDGNVGARLLYKMIGWMLKSEAK